jgi:hypothetical protein
MPGSSFERAHLNRAVRPGSKDAVLEFKLPVNCSASTLALHLTLAPSCGIYSQAHQNEVNAELSAQRLSLDEQKV